MKHFVSGHPSHQNPHPTLLLGRHESTEDDMTPTNPVVGELTRKTGPKYILESWKSTVERKLSRQALGLPETLTDFESMIIIAYRLLGSLGYVNQFLESATKSYQNLSRSECCSVSGCTNNYYLLKRVDQTPRNQLFPIDQVRDPIVLAAWRKFAGFFPNPSKNAPGIEEVDKFVVKSVFKFRFFNYVNIDKN